MRTAVVGLGLIGGSLLRALAGAGHAVLGYDADPATRAMARTAAAKAPSGRRWQVAGTVRDAIAGADLVVLAVPLPAVGTVLDELAASGFSGLVTDVTSVKSAVAGRGQRTGPPVRPAGRLRRRAPDGRAGDRRLPGRRPGPVRRLRVGAVPGAGRDRPRPTG